MMLPQPNTRDDQRGMFLLEVLVSIVIVSFGLLGMAGLVMKTQSMEAESYQRTMALMLVQDMANRINGDRANAGNYIGEIGANTTMIDCATKTEGKERNLCSWANQLEGANENGTGGLISAMGCITSPSVDLYEISVAWQGLVDTGVVPVNNCGKDKNYGGNGYRRVVSMQIYPKLN